MATMATMAAAAEQTTQQTAATVTAATTVTAVAAVATAAAAGEPTAAAAATEAAAATVATPASLRRVAVHRHRGEANHGQEQGDAQNQDAIHLDLQVTKQSNGIPKLPPPTSRCGPADGECWAEPRRATGRSGSVALCETA
jgi:hypothetical protein